MPKQFSRYVEHRSLNVQLEIRSSYLSSGKNGTLVLQICKVEWVKSVSLFLQDVDEALKRLPQEEVDARTQRLKRAMDLSLKHVYLPKELQAVQTPYNSYVMVRAPATLGSSRTSSACCYCKARVLYTPVWSPSGCLPGAGCH